jgi:hypothetical protein
MRRPGDESTVVRRTQDVDVTRAVPLGILIPLKTTVSPRARRGRTSRTSGRPSAVGGLGAASCDRLHSWTRFELRREDRVLGLDTRRLAKFAQPDRTADDIGLHQAGVRSQRGCSPTS